VLPLASVFDAKAENGQIVNSSAEEMHGHHTLEGGFDKLDAQQQRIGCSSSSNMNLLNLETDGDIRAFLMCRHVLWSFGRRFQARIIANCSVQSRLHSSQMS